jgi:hypothetical protein
MKNPYGQQKRRYFSITVLIAAAALVSTTGIMAFSNSPQVEAASTTSSCIDDNPCQTTVCSEGQSCKTIKSPNTGFVANGNTIQQQGPSVNPPSVNPPSVNPYYNDYLKDRQEFLEERQDMMEEFIE